MKKRDCQKRRVGGALQGRGNLQQAPSHHSLAGVSSERATDQQIDPPLFVGLKGMLWSDRDVELSLMWDFVRAPTMLLLSDESPNTCDRSTPNSNR